MKPQPVLEAERFGFIHLDWFIVAGYLATSVAIGLRGKRFVGNVSHCWAGSQKLILYIGIVTLAATEIATIRIVYNTELGNEYWFASFSAVLIFRLTTIFIGRTRFVMCRFPSRKSIVRYNSFGWRRMSRKK